MSYATPGIITPEQKRCALERPEPTTLEERRLAAFRTRVESAIEVAPSMTVAVLVGTADAAHVETVLRELRSVGWTAERLSDARDGDYLRIQGVGR